MSVEVDFRVADRMHVEVDCPSGHHSRTSLAPETGGAAAASDCVWETRSAPTGACARRTNEPLSGPTFQSPEVSRAEGGPPRLGEPRVRGAR